MPTILTKKSDTPGAVPATANLTNAAGGAELAVNTADKRLFTITSGSQVVEVGTTPSAIDTARVSATVLTSASATITNLLATSSTITDTSTAAKFVPTGNVTAGNGMYLPTTNTLAFSTNGSERVRFDSSGNVGIGTSSPTELLQINVAQPSNAGFKISSSSDGWVFKTVYQSNNNIDLAISSENSGTSPAERMRITSAGNVGLGVTPSAWGSGRRIIQVGASAYGALQDNGAGSFTVSRNYFTDGTSKYIANGTASIFSLENSGAFAWFTAPSGTAGNAITFTQAMTLDASGNLGIGSTSPAGTAGYKYISFDNASTGNAISFRASGTEYASIFGTNSGTTLNIFNTASGAGGSIIFGTKSTERARITAGGYSKFSNNGTYLSSTGTYHEFYQSANSEGLRVYTSDSSTYTGDSFKVDGERATTNSTYNLGNFRNGNGTGQCIIRDSGNIVNTNNSYGAISDEKMKQDIVDASSQWDDIKGLRVRKFRHKADQIAPLQIGVVAQEAELVSPGLIDESPDYEEVEVTDEEGNVTKERQPTGTSTKSVKYSVLYMKAIKALQEAMARIEQLEADVAALKGT